MVLHKITVFVFALSALFSVIRSLGKWGNTFIFNNQRSSRGYFWAFRQWNFLSQLIHRSSIILSSLSTEEFNIYYTNGKQRYHPRGLAEESPEIFQAHYGNYSQQCRSTLRVRRDRHGKVTRQQTDTRQPPPLVGPPIGHQTLTTRVFIHCTQSLSQLPVHVWHYANISPALVQLFVAASTDLMNK